MARRVMTQIETIKMAEVMKAHIRMLPVANGAAKLCEYTDGWDDSRTASEVAPDLSEDHAMRLRINLYGNLANKETKDKERIALLEKKLGDALVLISELSTKHDKLCMAISLARGGSLDARHLVIDQSVRATEAQA